jgi:hypothetical protein
MTDLVASAADAAYGYHALNLIGSVKRNSDIFDRIVVFDLGLDARQRSLLASVDGVEVRRVPPFVPHWAQCFTWKPWAWMQMDADRIFWLDAGATVLRSLAAALERVDDDGHFVVSQGNELRDIVPPDYFELYGLPAELASRPYVAAGIIGFRPGSDFFERVLVPTYKDCLAGRNLGFSPDEAISKNRGLGRMESPPIRNCRHFRWDQTLLNIHLLRVLPDAQVADLDEYAGWRSDRDHPRQVIWSHRRAGSLRYLKRVPYTGPGARRARALGWWYELSWSVKLRGKLLRWSTYVWKARSILSRFS